MSYHLLSSSHLVWTSQSALDLKPPSQCGPSNYRERNFFLHILYYFPDTHVSTTANPPREGNTQFGLGLKVLSPLTVIFNVLEYLASGPENRDLLPLP